MQRPDSLSIPPITARPTSASGEAPQDEAATRDPTFVVRIHPWFDPLVDESGHDPRSRYVERFWSGVLGPTACEVSLADSRKFHC